jgi:hypothetical protein
MGEGGIRTYEKGGQEVKRKNGHLLRRPISCPSGSKSRIQSVARGSGVIAVATVDEVGGGAEEEEGRGVEPVEEGTEAVARVGTGSAGESETSNAPRMVSFDIPRTDAVRTTKSSSNSSPDSIRRLNSLAISRGSTLEFCSEFKVDEEGEALVGTADSAISETTGGGGAEGPEGDSSSTSTTALEGSSMSNLSMNCFKTVRDSFEIASTGTKNITA